MRRTCLGCAPDLRYVGAWAEESIFSESAPSKIGEVVARRYVVGIAQDSEPRELAVRQALEHQVGVWLASDPARGRLLVHRSVWAPFQGGEMTARVM
jgi:hypothetical protein